MFNQRFILAVSLCAAASVAAVGQGNQGAEFLFQFPVPSSASSNLVGYIANGNPLSPIVNAAGPAGLASIIATPDGTKFYLVGTSGASPLQSVDSTFTNFHSINLSDPGGLSVNPTAAAMTPDGKYLLVGGTDASNFSYLFAVNTTTDQPVLGSGIPIQLPGAPGPFNGQSPGCPSCWIAVSRDAQTAYVLTNSAFGSSQVSSYNLASFQKLGSTVSIAGYATAITLSPQGVLYVTGGNQILVMDPATLNITNTIQVTFNFGPLQFTPDGTAAYSINQSPVLPQGSAASLAQLNVANGTVTLWPPQVGSIPGPLLTSVMVAGNNEVFAFSRGLTTLYDIIPNPLNGIPSQVVTSALSAAAPQNILAAAISNEVPSARYLFVLVANGSQPYLSRVDLTTNTESLRQGSPGLSSGVMQFVGVPVQTGAASILQYNNPQIVKDGFTSLPLIARVLNAAGQPVYKLPVTFTTDTTSGVVINNPNTTTNADGYVQTTVSIPTAGVTCTGGACNIALTAGAVTPAVFTVTVPGATGGTGTGGTGGSGGTGSSSQVIIVSGNGQLVQTGQAAGFPLTVEVTDTTGKPLAGVQVTFNVTSGASGSVGNGGSTAVTDSNGLASTNYFAQSISQSLAFENNTVTAQTQYGSANFIETTFAITTQGGVITGQPQTSLLAPTPGIPIVVAQGTPTVNGIQATVFTQSQPCIGCPVPGVGVVLTSNGGPAPISCQGAPVSDATGLVSCNVVASCSATPGSYPLTISIGGLNSLDREVTITSGGAASQITLASGNNQSGGVGQRLAQPLVATILNGCGAPVAGAQVTWTVTGSATLTSTISTSDSAGHVSTSLTFGSTPGAIQVKANLPGVGAVTYTVTNQVVIAGLTVVSGNNQTANINQTFPSQLVVAVRDVNGNPVPGVMVFFNVTSGVAGLNPASIATGTTGQAATTVTAGATPGVIAITATGGGFTTTFNLTSTPPGPAITASSFVNAASFAPGLVPCGLGIVTGTGLAAGVTGVVSGISPFLPLPYSLGGFSMSVNGVQVPIESISNQNGVQQVNFQTPCEVQPGSATVVTTINGTNTTIQGVQVLQAQPGIFTYQGANGKAYAAVIRASDGSYVTPNNFAHRGETYYVVLTGLGQTNPPVATNSTGVAGLNVVPQLIVGVDNAGVPVVSQQYFVGSIGAYLVGFQIPTSAPTGPDQPFAVAAIVNGSPVYGNPVFLPGVQ